jgi:hypothetical protein
MELEERIKEIVKSIAESNKTEDDVWFPCAESWNCNEYGANCFECVTNRILAAVKEAGYVQLAPEQETLPLLRNDVCLSCGANTQWDMIHPVLDSHGNMTKFMRVIVEK